MCFWNTDTNIYTVTLTTILATCTVQLNANQFKHYVLAFNYYKKKNWILLFSNDIKLIKSGSKGI